MIEFKNTTISFDQKPIIDNFSWLIPPGTKAVLTGASGKGKSSLLNAIAGFVPIEEGAIFIDGKKMDMTSVLTIREQLAYLPQDLSLDFHLTSTLGHPTNFSRNFHQKVGLCFCVSGSESWSYSSLFHWLVD